MTGTNQQMAKSLALTLLLAVSAFAIWTYEIRYIVGWESTKWVYVNLFSPFIIALLTAFSAIAPFYILKKERLNSPAILGTIILFSIGIGSYFFTKTVLMDLFRGSHLLEVSGILLANGAVFYLVISKLIRKIHPFYAISIVLAIIASTVFSTFAHYNFVEGIKIGYPFFFIVFNIGLVSTLTARFSKQKVAFREFEEVLDYNI